MAALPEMKVPITVQLPERKADGIPNILMLGSSILGGGSFLYMAFELIHSQPERGFLLLQQWGPWAFGAMFITWALYKLLAQAMVITSTFGDRVINSIDNNADQLRSLAEAAHAQALALQSTADKDDREKQEMQNLIGMLNSKVGQALDEIKRQNRAFERIEDALKINRPVESELK